MRKELTTASALALAAALVACDRKDADVEPAAVDRQAVDAATSAETTATDSGMTDPALTMPANATEFVRMAAQGNMLEITTSKAAETRATSPEVKTFAQMIVLDHTAVAGELKAAAQGEAVPATLDAMHQAKVTALENSGAGAFDGAYLDLQQDAHGEAITLFESYASAGGDAELKAFAAETLPSLRAHLAELRAIRASVDASAARDSMMDADDTMGLGEGADDALPDNDTPDVPVSSPPMTLDPIDPTIEPPADNPLAPDSTPNAPEEADPPVPPG